MSTVEVDIEIPATPVEVVAEPTPAPVFNAADLLSWQYAWSDNPNDNVVDFAYRASLYVNRKEYKEPVLLHAHSTSEWITKIKNGL